MLAKIIILVLAGITLVQPYSDVIKAFTDVDYQASGAQYLRWSVDVYTKIEEKDEEDHPFATDRQCSGSLVTPTVVISAARCFWGPEGLQPASRFLVARTYGGDLNGRSWHSLDKSEHQPGYRVGRHLNKDYERPSTGFPVVRVLRSPLSLGITLVQPYSDVIKAFTDVDYQASGAQYLRWSVDVYTKIEEKDEEDHPFATDRQCSGSLVTPTVVISAARCFWGPEGLQPASRFLVARTYGGDLNGRSWHSLDKSEVRTINVPPTFRGRTGLYADDIAVVTIATPLRSVGVTTICVSFDEELDRRQLADGNYGRNMGTLQLAGYGLPSPLFTALEVPYVTRQRCANESDSFFRERLSPDKICTGFKPGPGGKPESLLCRGDHGSGLAFYTGSGHHATPYLRGVASTPFPDPDGPSIVGCATFRFATFTHVASQRAFLERHVPGLEEKCAEYYGRFECNCYCNKNNTKA